MPYCIDINADEPIMLLDRHIGFDSEDGMGDIENNIAVVYCILPFHKVVI